MSSWLPIPADSDFTLNNIPFGVFLHPGTSASHCATRIGNHVLDLHVFSARGGFAQLACLSGRTDVFQQATLNAFAALGREVADGVRVFLQSVFASSGRAVLRDDDELRKAALFEAASSTMLLPMRIGDYTDFYAGRVHAYNVGCLFRGAENALQKNYEQLPVGYHGRASSVLPSGTPVRRPWGQTAEGVFEKSRRLDLELELAAFVGSEIAAGDPRHAEQAGEHIFGFVLMNDWSARDIQSFEYVPLGPFTSKNFGTSISPWIVLPSALTAFLTAPLQRASGIPLHRYLQQTRAETVYDVSLTVEINGHTLARTSGKNLLWSFDQMLAHHTVTGCGMNTGDLIGSGTISGPRPGEAGCLLEATKGGKEPVALVEGVERKWLEDGDEVVIRGHCGEGDSRVGWGDCRGRILPAADIGL